MSECTTNQIGKLWDNWIVCKEKGKGLFPGVVQKINVEGEERSKSVIGGQDYSLPVSDREDTRRSRVSFVKQCYAEDMVEGQYGTKKRVKYSMATASDVDKCRIQIAFEGSIASSISFWNLGRLMADACLASLRQYHKRVLNFCLLLVRPICIALIIKATTW